MSKELNKKSPKKRLTYLDLLRGTFLVAIILNHSPFNPKITDLLTGDGALISSAAEGFFILSGLMVGYLYLPKILTHTRTILKKIWSRALLLYFLSLITTVIFTVIGFLWVDPTSGGIYNGNIYSIGFIRDVLSLQYTYGWADFLSRYAVFMLFAPFVLFLIAYKKTSVVLILSLLLWFISPAIGLESFSAWQILFTIGIVFGANLDTILSYLSSKKGKILLYTFFTISAITVGWSLFVHVIYPHFVLVYLPSSGLIEFIYSILFMPQEIYESLFSKETLGPLRIIVSIMWFTVALYLFKTYEKNIKGWLRSLLDFLGRNSLTTYITHAFIIFFINIIYLDQPDNLGLLINSTIAILAVAVTTLLVHIILTTRQNLVK